MFGQKWWRAALALTAIGVTLAMTAPARAAAEDDGYELIKRAIEMRRSGDDQGARPLFLKAYQASHSPRSAAQLGFCEQALGLWADAEVHLGEALRVPNDAWVTKNRPAIEQALMLIKSRIARVEISGEPEGAEVAVNGNVVGRLPLDAPVRVAGGDIEIELRAPGYLPATKRLHVAGGQYQRTMLHAEKEPPPAAAPIAQVAAPVVVRESPAPPPSEERAPVRVRAADATTSEGSGPGRRSLKFIAWGLALGAGAYGLYGYSDYRERFNEFKSGCGVTVAGEPVAKPDAPPGFNDVKCRSLKNRYQWSSTVGIIGAASAGVLTATGFVLWATETDPTPSRTALGQCLRTLSATSTTIGCTILF